MIHWHTATVKQCVNRRKGLQVLEVELSHGATAKAIHYTDVLPPVNVGDKVLLNTTAVDLSLGTGGFHFVYSIMPGNDQKSGGKLSFDSNDAETVDFHNGHMMKLRYTSQQRLVLAAEEQNSPYHLIFKEDRNLKGMPVLIGELHSMLPIAVCWFRLMQQRFIKKQVKITYIMTDGGALPLDFSNHVALLNDLGWLAGTVTYGQAYGGDLETMNKYTALIASKHILHADLAIVSMGPGIAGTGTVLGHSGVEVGELVNAVSTLGGIPIVIPRISFTDQRERHNGLSHHTLNSLKYIALKAAIIPLPNEISNSKKNILSHQLKLNHCDQKHSVKWVSSVNLNEITQSQRLYPKKITTMGKGLSEDPDFFLGVCSAAQVAWNYCSGEASL